MQYLAQGKKWEYNPQMTLQDFAQENQDLLNFIYEDEYPEKVEENPDGEYRFTRHYGERELQKAMDIMTEIYPDWLSDNS